MKPTEHLLEAWASGEMPDGQTKYKQKQESTDTQVQQTETMNANEKLKLSIFWSQGISLNLYLQMFRPKFYASRP